MTINCEINRPEFVSGNVKLVVVAVQLARSLSLSHTHTHTHTLMDTGSRGGVAESVLDRVVFVGGQSA